MDIDANTIIDKLLNQVKQLTLSNIIKDIQIENLTNEVKEMKNNTERETNELKTKLEK